MGLEAGESMDIVDTIGKCARIVTIASKPDSDEYWKIATITSLGIVLIGIIGLIISAIFVYI